METQRRKWINLSYLVVAILSWVVFSALAMKGVAILDLEARVKSVDLIVRIAALVVGAVVFLVLYRNARVGQFMDEVYLELGRVTWPTQKETTNSTWIVILMVLVAGLALGFLDYVCTKLIGLVI